MDTYDSHGPGFWYHLSAGYGSGGMFVDYVSQLMTVDANQLLLTR